MKPCSKCGGPKDYPYKIKSGTTYYRCRPCLLAATGEWKAENQPKYRHQGKARKHCAPAAEKQPKAPWEPVWAAQSTPEIVAAVREARAAQRRLGVGK